MTLDRTFYVIPDAASRHILAAGTTPAAALRDLARYCEHAGVPQQQLSPVECTRRLYDHVTSHWDAVKCNWYERADGLLDLS